MNNYLEVRGNVVPVAAQALVCKSGCQADGNRLQAPGLKVDLKIMKKQSK